MSKYPIFEHHWRRGHYVAEITGRDKRYGLAREFLQGTPVKSRRVVKHEFREPCVIEVASWSRDLHEATGNGKVREYYAVTAVNLEKIPDGVDIGRIASLPKPGEPGSYGDGRCRCGAPAVMYDTDGVPGCGTGDTQLPAVCAVEQAAADHGADLPSPV